MQAKVRMDRFEKTVSVNKFFQFIAKANAHDIFLMFSFTLITAIGAQITIPVQPVPFTLQTMMVVLAGAFLGAKKGAYSQVIYLLLGCLGLPVFAQIPDSTIGFARLFGPTGGYLLAFPIGAFLTGYLAKRPAFQQAGLKSYFGVIVSMLCGELFILLFGSMYLGIVYLKDVKEALIAGAAVFLIWTVVKDVIGASIYFGITKRKSR